MTRIRGVWWLAPAGSVAFIALPSLVYAWSLGDGEYRALWRTPKALTDSVVVLLLIGLAVFAAASMTALIGRRRPAADPWPALSDPQRHFLYRASSVLFWLTVAGYAAFGALGVARGATPGSLVSALVSQNTYSGELKAMFAPVAGVTTFTQVGIAFVIVATLLLVQGGRPPRLVWRLLVVFGLALLRAFVLSERLALLELAIPVLAIVAMHRASDPRRWVRRGIQAAPLVLIPTVLLLFSAFEFSRSWTYFAGRTSSSFLDFAVGRLAGYYATSFNNGALAMQFEPVPGRLPLRTLEGFWSAPVIDQIDLYRQLSAPGTTDRFTQVITVWGNPEFNNPCGLCDPFTDWGPLGGILVLAVLGVVLGLVYRDFANARPMAMLTYPLLVTGLFELPRYLYWTQGRVVPALAALIVVGWLLRRRAGPGSDPPAGPEPSRGAADPEPSVAGARA